MAAFPKDPTPNIDWSNIGLQGFDETCHVESTFSFEEDEKWTLPKVVRDPWVKIHGLSPALNYGQQCYEGMRACRSKDNTIILFRPAKHAQRMMHSAEVVSIPPVPEDIFIACIRAAIRANSEFIPPYNSNAQLYIRPVLYGSGPSLPLSPPSTFTFCVYVQPTSAMYGMEAVDAVVLEDFDRAATRGVGHAKIGGNYAPTMRWTSQAQEEGFLLTLHLDSATRSYIEEFSSCAFAGVRRSRNGNVTLVVPDSPNIIDSITADSCIHVAKHILGWEVERRAVTWDELAYFDEVLAMGTAVLLLPVKSISRVSKNQKFQYCDDAESEPGISCRILRDALYNVVFGITDGPDGWQVPVYPDTDTPHYGTRPLLGTKREHDTRDTGIPRARL